MDQFRPVVIDPTTGAHRELRNAEALLVPHLGTAAAAPTVAVAAAAGLGASVSLAPGSSDASGVIVLAMGTSVTIGTQTLATLTFANAFANAPSVTFSPNSANAVGCLAVPSATGFAVALTGIGLTLGGQTLRFSYQVVALGG